MPPACCAMLMYMASNLRGFTTDQQTARARVKEGSPAAPAEAPVVAATSGAEVARPLSPLPTVASSVKKVRAVNRAGRLLREPKSKSGATSEVIRL